MLGVYAAEVRGALVMADTPAHRVEAIVRASFAPRNFRVETVSSWMNFYALAQRSDEAERLLNIYHRRLRSNLRFALRPLVGSRAEDVAGRVAALIDGVYLRQSLGGGTPDSVRANRQVMGYVTLEIEKALI